MKFLLCIVGIFFYLNGVGQNLNDSTQIKNQNIGVYLSISQYAFNRDGGILSNPLVSNNYIGIEAGIRIPITSKEKYASEISLGYSRYGINEYFEGDQVERIETTVKMNGVKLIVLPVILKFGSENKGARLGIGGFGIFNFSSDYSSDPVIQTSFTADQIASLVVGWNVQIGFQFKNYMLDINVINSFSNIIDSHVEGDSIKMKGLSLGLTYLL